MIKKIAYICFCISLCTFSLSVRAATEILFESDAGDYIGQGETLRFDPPMWETTVGGSDTRLRVTMRSSETSWNVEFDAPLGRPFKRGERYSVFNSGYNSDEEPILSVTGRSRGCGFVKGWFEVKDIVIASDGSVARIALDFKQNCQGVTAALYGAIRFNSSEPLQTAKFRAVPLTQRNVFGRDVVTLDGKLSFNRSDSSGLQYVWQQLSGTPVVLNHSNSDFADFIAPLVGPAGEDLVFRLTTTTSSSVVDTDLTRVHVRSKSTKQTFFEFRGEPGNGIADGQSFRVTPEDDGIFFLNRFDRGADLSNPEGFLSVSGSGVQTFGVGSYEDTRSSSDASHPGLSVGARHSACGSSTGRYDVLAASGVGASESFLAVDFEYRCEGRTAALRGSARFQYLPPGIPVAVVGDDRNAYQGERVVLDGSRSSDDKKLIAYQWRQIEGPAVSLSGATTPSASFDVSRTSPAQRLRFNLLVADAEDLTAIDDVVINVLAQPSPSPGPPPADPTPSTPAPSTPTPPVSPQPTPPATENPANSSRNSEGGSLGLFHFSGLWLAWLFRSRQRRDDRTSRAYGKPSE